jgi:hypothetical protein
MKLRYLLFLLTLTKLVFGMNQVGPHNPLSNVNKNKFLITTIPYNKRTDLINCINQISSCKQLNQQHTEQLRIDCNRRIEMCKSKLQVVPGYTR